MKQSIINKSSTNLITNLLLFSGLLISLIIITSITMANALVNLDEKNNSTKNSTNLMVAGPTKVIKSKPTGNYTNYVNGTYVYSGPTKVIKSKPTGNYTNGTSLSVGPTKVIKSKPTGNYTNGTSLISVGPTKVIEPKPQQPIVANNNSRQSQVIGEANTNAIGQRNAGSGIISSGIAPKPITKEEAMRAEQQATAMIKTYNEKANQQSGAGVTTSSSTTTPTTTTVTNASQSQSQSQPQLQQPITQGNNSNTTTTSEPTEMPGILP